MDRTLAEIHVIITATAPLLTFLSTVNSTILINFFVYNKAFSTYPNQTFLLYRAFHLQRDGSRYASFVDQHQRQGWKFPFIKSLRNRNPQYPPQEVRRIGDIDTWTISFEADNMIGNSPDYVLEYSQFSCRVTYTHTMASPFIDQEGFPCDIGSYRIGAGSFTARYLWYQYTVSPKCSWRKFLFHEMERRREVETQKLIAANTSPDIGGSNVGSGSTRPDSSQECPMETTFDHEIPQLYSEWLHSDAVKYAWHKNRFERLNWT